MTLSEKFQFRPATWDDVATIVDLRNASSQSTRGSDVTAVQWQKRQWYDSGIDLESDALLIFDGELAVATVELSGEFPYVVYEMVGAVHPGYRGQGLGDELVCWTEKRARQTLDRAPEGAAVFIQNSIFDSNTPCQELLAAHGYEIVRDFVYLQIHMEEAPEEADWPAGIEVRLLQTADWAKAGPALYEAFEDHWGSVAYEGAQPQEENDPAKPNPRETDPEAFDSAYWNSPGLCFVAWDGDEVAGLCLCNATTVEYPDAGYLGSLSVRRRWRKLGLGRALTLHALRAFYDRGTSHVLTDTDGDGFTKAFRVYEKAGMAIFRRELVYEKEIHPGQDLLKRNMEG